MIYRACLRILGRPHDAEDVAQEAFLAAFRSIGGFRGEGSVRGWLMRIATRQAFRDWLSAARRPTSTRSASRCSRTRAPIQRGWWSSRNAEARSATPWRRCRIRTARRSRCGSSVSCRSPRSPRPRAPTEHGEDPSAPRPGAAAPDARSGGRSMIRHPYGPDELDRTDPELDGLAEQLQDYASGAELQPPGRPRGAHPCGHRRRAGSGRRVVGALLRLDGQLGNLGPRPRRRRRS